MFVINTIVFFFAPITGLLHVPIVGLQVFSGDKEAIDKQSRRPLSVVRPN